MVKDELNKVEKLGIRPFTRFCMSIGAVPSSYIAGLTIEEQLLWLCSYLEKEVIPTVNNNGQAVEELQDLFVELKNYVDNYFDNLDVQEEINNKLDEMADDGTLEEIMASYLQTKAIFGFDNVAALKEATNLREGSFARTLGYLTPNDGGGATYRVREIINTDVVDEGSIIALNDEDLVAELIIEDKVNVLNFGYTVDEVSYDSGTHNLKNITDGLKNAITYLISKSTSDNNIGLQIYFPEDSYYIDDTIDLKTYSISLLGDSAPIKGVDYRIGAYTQKIITNIDGELFTNGRLYLNGINFYNIHAPSTNDIIFSSANVRDIRNCVINNYDIVINHDINTVTTINGNYFLNCRKYCIKGNVVDCIITNNYINAERELGNVTYAFSCGLLSMTTIFNNFIDFFTFAIEGRTQCQGLRIENNTIDYCYRGIKIGGVETGVISNNTFNHISKSYNGTMLHYANDSTYALNDWYAIETTNTIPCLTVESNTIINYDKFITIPHIALTDSIICNNNNMDDFTKYGSFYKQLKSENVKILDLDKKEYLVEPTYSNTYMGQLVLYNGVYFRNIGNSIYSVGLKSLENEYNKSYTTAGEGNYTIDLSNITNGALYNNMILEIKTTKNYYSLKTALYKIFRIGGTAYALTLFDNTDSDLKPAITNTGTTLNITMSGSYETGSNSKQVTYRVYEQ